MVQLYIKLDLAKVALLHHGCSYTVDTTPSGHYFLPLTKKGSSGGDRETNHKKCVETSGSYDLIQHW